MTSQLKLVYSVLKVLSPIEVLFIDCLSLCFIEHLDLVLDRLVQLILVDT